MALNIERAAVTAFRGLFLLPVIGIAILMFLPVGAAITNRPRDSPEASEQPEVPEATHIVIEEPETGLPVTPSGNVYTDEIPMTYGYQCVMQDACRKYDVPYSLALAMAEVESGWDFDAWSGYAYGIMQINPVNYGWLRELGIDPETKSGNIEAGVNMIGDLLARYGDTHKALMAYNCGEAGAAELWDEGYTTSEYSRKVVAAAEKWAAVIE